MKIIFAHGFEGTPNGSKYQFMTRLGHTVISPDLYHLGMKLSDMKRVILNTLDEHLDAEVIVGSSMGGLSSAWALNERPHRNIRAILLAPAFGVWETWTEKLGEEVLQQWESSGERSHFHQGQQREISLPFALWTQIKEVSTLSFHNPLHQVTIIHGTQDDIIPIKNSVSLCDRSSVTPELIVVEDGHRLHESLTLLEGLLQD